MLIAAHKSAPLPSDSFYLPVHVGHALNAVDLGYQADDDGENISAQNRSYCELTAIYWAWKNLDADVLGLSHYRRYFRGELPGPNGSRVLSEPEAARLLTQHDIVLARPRNYVIETIDSHYRNGHHGEDLDVLRAVLEGRSPEFLAAFDEVFSGRKLSLYNMFLMKRDLFDEYASWLFPILDDVAARIDNDSRTAYQQRTIGYLGERLLNVWARAQATLYGRSVGYAPVINTEGESKIKKGIGLINRKLRGGAVQ